MMLMMNQKMDVTKGDFQQILLLEDCIVPMVKYEHFVGIMSEIGSNPTSIQCHMPMFPLGQFLSLIQRFVGKRANNFW